MNGGQLDSFPFTWIEGTAVMMEHAGWDYIKDYLQYAPPFFQSNTMSFFNYLSESDLTVYTNSLLTIYLYERATGQPRIDFPKTIFYNNYNDAAGQAMPFDTNLRLTSSQFGSSWVGLLNRFHAGSYFAGTRADTTKFLSDAAFMGPWSFSPDMLDKTYSVTKQAGAYAMQVFDFTSTPFDADSLTVTFAGETPQPGIRLSHLGSVVHCKRQRAAGFALFFACQCVRSGLLHDHRMEIAQQPPGNPHQRQARHRAECTGVAVGATGQPYGRLSKSRPYREKTAHAFLGTQRYRSPHLFGGRTACRNL